MLTQPDIDSLIERAEKMQDGITFNRDLFSRDVIRAAKELRNWREAHARQKAETPKNEKDFSSSFADIFGDIFKDKK